MNEKTRKRQARIIIVLFIIVLVYTCSCSRVTIPSKKGYIFTPEGFVDKDMMLSSEKKANRQWIKKLKRNESRIRIH